MNPTWLVDDSCKCLESYFQKLFDLLQVGVAEEEAAPIKAEDAGALESQAPYHGFAHLIKPGMLINIYSTLDFWLVKLCSHHKEKNNLNCEYTAIKAKNTLAQFHKYLTCCAGLDLSAVEESYHHLHNLRKIRNIFTHEGGHVKEDDRKKYENIPGISLSITLVLIEDRFIWESLEHAKKYLKAIALPLSK